MADGLPLVAVTMDNKPQAKEVEAILSPSLNPEEKELLRQLNEANRLLEADERSMQSLSHSNNSKQSSVSGHSRKGSMSSIVSNTSVSSNISNLQFDDDSSNPDDAWILWGKIVNDWDQVLKRKASYVKDLLHKGIPHHFRGIVWQLLCNAHNCPVKEQYADYLKMTSPSEKVIRRDITRTYPEHEFFKEKNGLGQESLFNVMKAYSLYDREVGYCQGSGFIVGLLLMQMPEEEAFAVLVQMMNELQLRDLFKPNMTELGLCMFQLECLIQEQLPSLYMHFQSQNFHVSMFASSWFLTLFTTVLTLPVACRIFDIFLSEGLEVVFRIGLAILAINQDALMSQDMEGMLKFMQQEVPTVHEQNIENMVYVAYQVKFNPRKMKKLEKEYSALKSREQEDQVELRRLRTENRLLRQRIDNLEKETATLADRLIQDQVTRAQKEEEVFILRRDLSTLSSHDAETTLRLQEVTQELEETKHKERPRSATSAASVSSTEDEDDRKIRKLEKQLKETQKEEANSKEVMRELREKIRELEHTNRQLQQEPSAEIQQLQEELIACKLREAEASLALKELQQRVHDLDKCWQRHMEKWNSANGPSKMSKNDAQHTANELMSTRLREARVVAELKDSKQRVMELETQNQICSRQIKRMDEEKSKLQGKLDEYVEKEKDQEAKSKEIERKLDNLESKRKEDSMMMKIKDAEHSQSVAEMRQRIAELEIENQELVTAGELHEKGETQELEDRISDLQDEVLQLKMAKRLQSISSMALNHMVLDTESDYDTDDMDASFHEVDKLKLAEVITSDSHGHLPLPVSHRLKMQDVDSSEGEGLYDFDDGTIKRRTSKKKRKSQQNRPDVTPHTQKDSEGVVGIETNSHLTDDSDKTLDNNIASVHTTSNGSTLKVKEESLVGGSVNQDNVCDSQGPAAV